MDAITQFQNQFAEPVYGFLGEYWYFAAFLALALVAWFLKPARYTTRDGTVVTLVMDGDDDGDGSDGGGGDGGGGD